MNRKIKLRDPRTCRIFFSSPFGGMEEEREELTKKYFPQIHHACNAKGIKFVPVDMRWGITKEAAENAQVMNICLREVSRSDCFVGFFGQRYGWHSAHSDDSILMENFEKAMEIYPWVEKFKDRSMTEIECRAGHLNNPGEMPVCFCFRDKEYDDIMKEEGLKNQNSYQVMKFSIENEFADQMRSNLIQEVMDTQDKTLGVKLNCKNPQEMAKFIFDTLWKFLTEVVLVDLNEEEVPYLVQQRLLHDQFVSTASHIFCGCEEYLDQLMSKITDSPTKGTVVTGPAGCGKSALLAKWMQLVQQTHPYITVIYHFIGCAPGTERPRIILERILLELRESFPNFKSKTPAPDDNSSAKKKDNQENSVDELVTEKTPVSDNEKAQDDSKNEPLDQTQGKSDSYNTNNGEKKDENSNKNDVDDQNASNNESKGNIDEKMLPDSFLIDEKIATNIFIVPKMTAGAKTEVDKMIVEVEIPPEEEKPTLEDKTKSEEKTTSENKSSSGDNKTNSEDKSNAGDKKTSDDSTTSEKIDAEKKETDKERESLKKKSQQQILSEITILMQRISEDGHKVVILLDALNQQKTQDKTIKHLYWLPEAFPEGITFVCSTLDTDEASHDLLVSQRGMDKLVINPFDSELQQRICVETLKVAGKELSPHQLECISNAKETSNALFLKLVLYELSIYGSFSNLDKKIESLISVSGVKPLLQVILERLELDYCSEDYQGNIVKDVLCCLIASRKGLSESEMTEILSIPAHLWSPLFFALEHLLSQYTGLLGFAFSEMREAVVERYLKDVEQIIPYKQKLIKYFNSIRETMRPWIKNNKPEYGRVTEELPWLQIDIKDTEGLIQTLSDLSILRKIAGNNVQELLFLWQQTGLPWSAVSNLYMTGFDKVVADLYQEFQNGVMDEGESPGMKIRVTLQHMRVFFDSAYYSRGCQRAMEREIRVLENCKSSLTEEKRAEYLRDARYYLAISYSEQQVMDKALTMYMAIHEECQKMMEESESIKDEVKEMLAFTCNGIGLIHYHLKDNVKAEDYLTRSKKFHREMGNKMHEGASTTNLGLTLLNEKKYDKALEYFHEAMQLYEDHFFGKISIDMGNLYTNIALTYRRMKNLDKAEEYYHKSLEMKAMNVGWNHPVIATAFMNLGTLEVHRKNYVKAEEWTRKAISIYEVNEFPVTDRTHRMCRENLCVNMIKQGKKEEIVPLYIEITHILVDNGFVDEIIISLHKEMLELLLDKCMYKEVEKFTLSILASAKRRARFAYLLAELDNRHPPKVPRPPELTLEAFMKEYPEDDSLKILYVTSVLSKKNSVDEIIELCHELHRKQKDLKESAYSFAGESLNGAKFYESALKVLEIGLEKYPDHLEILNELAVSLIGLNRMDELAKYVPLMLAAPDWEYLSEDVLMRVAKNLTDSNCLLAGKCFEKIVNKATSNRQIQRAKEHLQKLYPDGLLSDSDNNVNESSQKEEGVEERTETVVSSDEVGIQGNETKKEDQKAQNGNEECNKNGTNSEPITLQQDAFEQIPNLLKHQSMDVAQNYAALPDIKDEQIPNLQMHQSMSVGQNYAITPETKGGAPQNLNEDIHRPPQLLSSNQNQAASSENVTTQNGPDSLFIAHQLMSVSQNQAISLNTTDITLMPGENNENSSENTTQNLNGPESLPIPHQCMNASQNQAITLNTNDISLPSVHRENNDDVQKPQFRGHQAMNPGQNH